MEFFIAAMVVITPVALVVAVIFWKYRDPKFQIGDYLVIKKCDTLTEPWEKKRVPCRGDSRNVKHSI